MEQPNTEQEKMERTEPEQTEAKKEAEKRSFDFAYNARLIAAVLLAFAGTYFTLPQRGLVSTLPVYVVAILIAALLRLPVWQKAALFGVFAFIFTTVYYKTEYALIFALICIVTVLLCSLAFHLMTKKKVLTSIISVLLIFVCVLPHPLLFGTFPQALQADNMIREYVSKHYTSDEIVVSGTAYDFETGCYKATVYDVKAPIERYSLNVYRAKLTDSFKSFSEIKLMEKRTIEITEALRERFPNDRFSVKPLGIVGYPFEDQISLSDPNDYNDNMRFEIQVPGYMFKEDFAKKAEAYYNALLQAKLTFREVVFIGGGDYLNALSVSVPCDLFPKDFEGLIKPSRLLPLKSSEVFESLIYQ